MKKWKVKELYITIERFKKIYWKKIGIKDRLFHRLFEGMIEKFGIASFVYGYEVGIKSKNKKSIEGKNEIYKKHKR